MKWVSDTKNPSIRTAAEGKGVTSPGGSGPASGERESDLTSAFSFFQSVGRRPRRSRSSRSVGDSPSNERVAVLDLFPPGPSLKLRADKREKFTQTCGDKRRQHHSMTSQKVAENSTLIYDLEIYLCLKSSIICHVIPPSFSSRKVNRESRAIR